MDHKNVVLSPLQFVGAQLMMLSPISVFLWLPGVIWLLVSRRSREWRFLGWTYVVFLMLMFATRDAKDYYLAAIYPAIFAAGGVGWQALLKRRSTGLAPAGLRNAPRRHRDSHPADVVADPDPAAMA